MLSAPNNALGSTHALHFVTHNLRAATIVAVFSQQTAHLCSSTEPSSTFIRCSSVQLAWWSPHRSAAGGRSRHWALALVQLRRQLPEAGDRQDRREGRRWGRHMVVVTGRETRKDRPGDGVCAHSTTSWPPVQMDGMPRLSCIYVHSCLQQSNALVVSGHSKKQRSQLTLCKQLPLTAHDAQVVVQVPPWSTIHGAPWQNHLPLNCHHTSICPG